MAVVNDTIRLGRVAGIPVGVHWSALLVGVVVTVLLGLRILPQVDPGAGTAGLWIAATAGTLAFFGSLLAHEFGHAVVARRHGVGVIGLTLWVLGGVAKLTRQAPTPRAEFQIAAAGPLANFVCAGVFGLAAWGLHDTDGWRLIGGVAIWLTAVNLLLGVTNLAPGSPLDGGRVLAAFLWRRGRSAERARLIAARAGVVLGLLVVTAGLFEALWFGQNTGWWTILIGLFVAGAARGDIAGAAIRGRLDATRLDTIMTRSPPLGSRRRHRVAVPRLVGPAARPAGHPRDPMGRRTARLPHPFDRQPGRPGVSELDPGRVGDVARSPRAPGLELRVGLGDPRSSRRPAAGGGGRPRRTNRPRRRDRERRADPAPAGPARLVGT